MSNSTESLTLEQAAKIFYERISPDIKNNEINKDANDKQNT
ncbi:MAG: hypothetical protein N2749_03755 [Clostridia bacterium]|nr:hypothetical protein [Clostridia bacterium]